MMPSRAALLVLLLAAGSCRGAPPAGVSGPDADALARELERAVRAEAWARTGAVTWHFAGRNRHLWDRRRGLARVAWGDVEALFAIDERIGVAFDKGVRLGPDAARSKLDEAHAKWTNDAFWLNPATKAFDDGVARSVVPPKDGLRGLLVQYGTGGRTPGDAYLWWLDAEGLPAKWQMWTSNIPVGGVEASWKGWVELGTGARVSTRHELPVFTLELTEVAGALTLGELVPGEDPFAVLLACRAAGDCARF